MAVLARMSSFLPEMAAANQTLEAERVAGRLEKRRLENVADGEGYIEMVCRQAPGESQESSDLLTDVQNLGLGVLEEKRDSQSESSSSSGDSEDDGVLPQDSPAQIKETKVLERLMGRKKDSTKTQPRPTIEEIGDG